ncbi:MAG TPA: glycoside hydrolase family 20 zincin-like fold domain-containing protein [Acidimicrobiales bacterium]|nr:glycoside hydrolase family 20 zincin-like fold domain-containing protein [Acidimicrobiales bacterium]
MTADDLPLLPRPRSVALTGARVEARPPAAVRDPSLPAQGYRLRISGGGVTIESSEPAGEFYARATLDQLASVSDDGRLPEGEIVDWPDLAVRGVMLDVSRDKVPTMATLKDLVARLASFKVNQVQLYMEHTFAYAGHEEVWASASPFTPDEIRELDRFCADRHVELVPNQNCLGHMERWLRHDRYRPLALMPDGWIDGRGRRRAPMTVDPSNPAALDLARDLLAQLVGSFSSGRVHVGLDEPWELPDDRFDDYLAFAAALRRLPDTADHEMLMWGDIVGHHPDRVADVPDGLTVCEWGYEDWHPFEERGRLLEKAARPFWVCPGTSSWMTILGRVPNMVGNCQAAADAARAHGAAGYLVTDWGDNGHHQYLPVAEPGFAYGAAVSWCLDANRDLDLAAALSAHTFADATGRLGAALVELGGVSRLIGPQRPNVSVLVLHLYSPRLRMGEGLTEGLTVDDLDRVRATLAAARASVASSTPTRAGGSLVVSEVEAACDLVDLLARDARARLLAGGRLDDVAVAHRLAFADELDAYTERHRELWLARNRAGGLDDSCARFGVLAAAHRAV